MATLPHNGILLNLSSFNFFKENKRGSEFKHFKRYRTFNRSQPLVYGAPHSMYELMRLNPSRGGYKSLIKTARKVHIHQKIEDHLSEQINQPGVLTHKEVTVAIKKKFGFVTQNRRI